MPVIVSTEMLVKVPKRNTAASSLVKIKDCTKKNTHKKNETHVYSIFKHDKVTGVDHKITFKKHILLLYGRKFCSSLRHAFKIS